MSENQMTFGRKVIFFITVTAILANLLWMIILLTKPLTLLILVPIVFIFGYAHQLEKQIKWIKNNGGF